jgi:hypothetical protein
MERDRNAYIRCGKTNPRTKKDETQTWLRHWLKIFGTWQPQTTATKKRGTSLCGPNILHFNKSLSIQQNKILLTLCAYIFSPTF